MFQVVSEVSWGGVGSGSNQGSEHGEIVTSDLQSQQRAGGRIRGREKGFLFTLNIFLQKNKQFKNPPLLYMSKYIFRSG